MQQEIQINISLTLSADATLSKSKIIAHLRKQLNAGVNDDKLSFKQMKVDKLMEEKEIYDNQ